MPLSFSYGASMDREAMASRCPRSRALGTARLVGHRLAIMREGYATIVRDPRESVHGVLWEIALSDMPALDRYEDLSSGLYVKRPIMVIGENGPRRALVYIGANAGPGTPRPGYLEAVIAAATAWNLPASHLGRLRALAEPGAGTSRHRQPPPQPEATAPSRWRGRRTR